MGHEFCIPLNPIEINTMNAKICERHVKTTSRMSEFMSNKQLKEIVNSLSHQPIAAYR